MKLLVMPFSPSYCHFLLLGGGGWEAKERNMVTRLRTAQQRNGGLISRMDKWFSPNLPDLLWVPASYSEYRSNFSANQAAGTWT